MANLNRNPYYDDFDERKQFMQILFRPGYAVQARELTQLQTILQKQIDRFGKHIFKEGSPVIGGNSFINIAAEYLRVEPSYLGAPIDLQGFVGKNIVGQTSGATGVVLEVAAAEGADPNTIVINKTNGIAFSSGEVISAGVTGPYANLQSAVFNGPSSTFHIDEGVIFAKGFFAFVEKQAIILSKYSNTPSVSIGLDIVEDIVTVDDDASLADPATGSPNANAPGADRLKISFELVARPEVTNPVDNASAENFVELARIKNGVVQKQVQYPIYSEIEKTLARRTYDESGDYTVRPFKIQITDNIDNDVDKLSIGLSPGKAYVKGFEFETISTEFLDVDRAREYEQAEREDLAPGYGSYIVVSSISGVFNPALFETVDLHNVIPGSIVGGSYNATKIGTAKIRYLQHSATGIYKLYVFDIQLSSSNFDEVLSIAKFDGANITATAAIDASGRSSGKTLLFGSGNKAPIALMPQSNIQTIRDANGQAATSYRFQREFDVQFTAGVGALSTSSGLERFATVLSNDTASRYFVVTVSDKQSSGTVVNGQLIPLTQSDVVINPAGAGSPQSATIDVGIAGANGTFIAKVVATIEISQAPARIKTRTQTQLNVTSPSSTVSLNIADGYRLIAVYDSGNPAVNATTSDTNITDRYNFSTGQKDEIYDFASISLKSGAAAPTGRILVVFEFFQHTGSSFFSVDSYTNITYADIPQYVSSTGTTYQLRDCLDFRPVRQSNNSIVGVTPSPDEPIEADYRYYVGRIDKVVASKDKTFKIVKGVPKFNPDAPLDLDDSMTLYVLTIPPYTFKPSDVGVRFVENKRYTMRDIGRIEMRVKNLEYYTSLGFLEKQAKDQTIKDSTGVYERFKNGFIVDSFQGHGTGDVASPEYRCSMDFRDQFLRAPFNSYNYQFNLDSGTNSVQTGQLLTLSYTQERVITQPLASKSVNVNPFNVTNWYGQMKLIPSSDTWFDTVRRPDVIVNLNGNNDAWEYITSIAPTSTQWNAWQDIWATRSETDRVSENWLTLTQDVVRTINTSTAQTRTGTQISVGTETVQQSMGDRLVDLSVVPYIRQQSIIFVATGMRPRTRVYAFFDGTDVNQYITKGPQLIVSGATGKFQDESLTGETITGQTSGATGLVVYHAGNYVYIVNLTGNFSIGETITGSVTGVTASVTSFVLGSVAPTDFVTDDVGTFAGVFAIPNTDNIQFRTGERQLRFTDEPSNIITSAKTTSEANFTAQGFSKVVENVVVSTVQPVLRRTTVTDERIINNRFDTIVESSPLPVPQPSDPLAQTFFVNSKMYPNGIFVKSLELFFRTKDESLPVTVQLRPTSNGYPSSAVIFPFSEVTLYPADVNVSTNPSVDLDSTKTVFEFESPVFLPPGEYSFVVLTNSSEYEVYVAEMGATQIGTTNNISEQPYTGSLFKSQNSTTWTAVQEEDVMFVLNKCLFDSTGNAIFENKAGDVTDFHVGNIMVSNVINKSNDALFSYVAKNASDDQFDLQYQQIIAQENFSPLVTKNLTDAGDFKLRIDMATTDPHTSPVVDVSRLSLIAVENIINNDSTGETSPGVGNAEAVYVTRRVTLAEGFDATGLSVFLDIDKPVNTDVEVYYKILNGADSATIDSRPYVKMDSVLSGGTGAADVFKEYEFKVPDAELNGDDAIFYTSGTGTFVGFKTFAVKIVMKSSNPVSIPRVRNLRAIALA